MPFVGLSDNDEMISPVDAGDDETVLCPKCGDDMETVPEADAGSTWIPRHFTHSTVEDCGGQSNKHLCALTVAASKLADIASPDTMSTMTGLNPEQPVLMAEFDGKHERFGEGICVDIDYGGIDTDETASSILDRGYSSAFLTPDDFADGFVDVDMDAAEWTVWWTEQVPPKERWLAPEWHLEMEFGGEKMLTAWEYEKEADFPPEWFGEQIRDSVRIGRRRFEEDTDEVVSEWQNRASECREKDEVRELIEQASSEIDDRNTLKRVVSKMNSRMDEIEQSYGSGPDVRDACAESDHIIVPDPRSPHTRKCRVCGLSYQTIIDWLGHDMAAMQSA